MECCKDLEIVLIDEDTLKIPRTFFSGLNDSFYGCENLKICSLKSIIDSYMKNFFSFKFKCAFEKCEKLRYVNFENMQENIGLWLTPGLLLRPFRGCNNLIAIFVNKDANRSFAFMLRERRFSQYASIMSFSVRFVAICILSLHLLSLSRFFLLPLLAIEQIKMYVPLPLRGKHGSNDSASRAQKSVLLC